MRFSKDPLLDAVSSVSRSEAALSFPREGHHPKESPQHIRWVMEFDSSEHVLAPAMGSPQFLWSLWTPQTEGFFNKNSSSKGISFQCRVQHADHRDGPCHSACGLQPLLPGAAGH